MKIGTLLLVATVFLTLLWLSGVLLHGLYCQLRRLRQQRLRRIQNTPLSLRVIERHDFNDELFWVRLAAKDNKTLANFDPGQFLTVCVALENQEFLCKRRYSISYWQPNPQYYELCIRRVIGGKVSTWLFTHLQPGAEIQVLPPAGEAYPVLRNQSEVILVAGGVGISPLRSIVQFLLQQSPSPRIVLFYSAGYFHEMCYYQEFETLSDERENFHFYPVLTRENPDWQEANGRLSVPFIMASVTDIQRATFLLCGPESMLDTLNQGLLDNGVKKAQIYFERFGFHGTSICDQSFRVRLTSGLFFQFQRQPNLLVALEEHGINMAGSCRTGECGDCRIRLLDGHVSKLHEVSIILDDNEILPCCCVPKSDLVIAV